MSEGKSTVSLHSFMNEKLLQPMGFQTMAGLCASPSVIKNSDHNQIFGRQGTYCYPGTSKPHQEHGLPSPGLPAKGWWLGEGSHYAKHENLPKFPSLFIRLAPRHCKCSARLQSSKIIISNSSCQLNICLDGGTNSYSLLPCHLLWHHPVPLFLIPLSSYSQLQFPELSPSTTEPGQSMVSGHLLSSISLQVTSSVTFSALLIKLHSSFHFLPFKIC